MNLSLFNKLPRWLWAVIALLLISTGWWGSVALLHNKPAAEGHKFKAKVVTPDFVRGRWEGVRIAVYPRTAPTQQVITVPLGQAVEVPGSKASIEVRTFLPAFMADGTTLTSATNSPSNPAAEIVISEAGKEVFSGWLMARSPVTHALQHPDFSVVLLEGVPRH